jgi:quercetin dioxygenase-like cupin family protein
MAATPVICPPDGGTIVSIGPTRNLVKVPGADTDQRLGVVEMSLAAGFAGPPPHVHNHIDHVFYVLAGTVRVRVDRTDHLLCAGSCAFIPAGTPHTFATTDVHSARLLSVDTPQPLDGYYADLASAFPTGVAVNPAVVAEIQARHDTYPPSPS